MLLTLRHALATLVTNNYGLAGGIDESSPTNAKRLGVWFGGLLDEVAGLDAGDHLTFGHLWYGRPPTKADGEQRPDESVKFPGRPRINLEMVSTCISHGRPYTFPTGKNTFYYERNVLETYLHPDIVATMVRNKRGMGASNLTDEEISPYVRMPVDRDLPVVLAARMSLAFPILLTAVKLGAIDFSKAARADTPKLLPEPCWFADGGPSSNFPIHLFDSPLPRWPTFAVKSRVVSARRERLSSERRISKRLDAGIEPRRNRRPLVSLQGSAGIRRRRFPRSNRDGETSFDRRQAQSRYGLG